MVVGFVVVEMSDTSSFVLDDRLADVENVTLVAKVTGTVVVFVVVEMSGESFPTI